MDLLLTFVLTVATVYLAVYTFRLVAEARASRRIQIQPGLSIYLEQAETDPTLLFIIFRNIGLGPAYELKFDIQKDIYDYGGEAMKIAERGTFKEGMRFCPAGYNKKHFLMETTLQYEKKMADDILLVATYKNALGDTFTDSFHLLLREQAKSSRMRPSDTYMGRISDTLEEIKKLLAKNNG